MLPGQRLWTENNMITRFIFFISLLTLSGDYGIRNGEALVEAMLNKYQNKWYETLTFEQETIRYDTAGNVVSNKKWYEAMRLPDQLVIKFEDFSSGNGMLFRNDSLYQFRDGEIAGSRPMIHPLLVLGFSVYKQPVEKTITALNSLGFDFSKFHKREYEGRQVYVVGADAGDETSNQFWIEKDRLLFVRSIQNFGNGRIQDIRFNKYEKLGSGWIAAEVLFYSNDKLSLRETYSKIRTPELSSNIFQPKNFTQSKWQ